jgi:hypothetical protein
MMGTTLGCEYGYAWWSCHGACVGIHGAVAVCGFSSGSASCHIKYAHRNSAALVCWLAVLVVWVGLSVCFTRISLLFLDAMVFNTGCLQLKVVPDASPLEVRLRRI